MSARDEVTEAALDKDAVERGARVLIEVGKYGVPWGDASDEEREESMELSRAVLTAAVTKD